MTEQTSEQMEIKYAPALQQLETPKFNYEQLKTQIIASREKFMGLVVSEDAIQEAKKTKAKLNSFKTMIDNERKRVKNHYLEPYEKVKPQYDELFNLIDEPVKAIDSQIKSFEQAELDKKLDEIRNIYNANIGPYSEIIPMVKIYNSQWENKDYSLKKIEAEMKSVIEHIEADLKVIKNFNSPFEIELRDTYLNSFDFNVVLTKKEQLEAQAKFVEEQAAKEQPVEETEPKVIEINETNAADVDFKDAKEGDIISFVEPIQEKVYTQTFTIVDATKNQLVALSDFMNKNGIKFVVPKKEAVA